MYIDNFKLLKKKILSRKISLYLKDSKVYIFSKKIVLNKAKQFYFQEKEILCLKVEI